MLSMETIGVLIAAALAEVVRCMTAHVYVRGSAQHPFPTDVKDVNRYPTQVSS